MNAISDIAAPRAQRSLEGVVAPLRHHVLNAVAAAMTKQGAGSPAWLDAACSLDQLTLTSSARSAWATTAILLIDMVRTGHAPDPARAGQWFGIDDLEHISVEVIDALVPLTGDERLAELLPYLLDTYGRTSRLDVMRDTSRSQDRKDRKSAGSFYTPSDVANFMVQAIASPDDEQSCVWWLDPAVGSGVFLVAALRNYVAQGGSNAEDFASTRLTGCDISPQACDFAAFAILAQLAKLSQTPLQTWTAIRRNIRAIDPTQEARRSDLRQALAPNGGALRLICNPPYATSSLTKGVLASGRPTSSMYLPFIEMAWSIAHQPLDAAALVVPLALAANRSADHRRCRVDMTAAGGDWTLLFFDRQPHALFGEEAKTRATIAIKRPGPSPAVVRTSRMLKWTSRQRPNIFHEDRAVSIRAAMIGRLVPKLGSSEEVMLYEALDSHRLRVVSRPEPVRAEASEIVGATLSPDVFVGGTAYNFLNVFRNYPSPIDAKDVLSTSGIHRMSCSDQEEADIVTAILVSRLTYWLWHAECDGFHVPAWFLSELPFLNMRLSPSTRVNLAVLGRAAWKGLQEDAISSKNKDRVTLAFRPTKIGQLRSHIDRELVACLGMPQHLADTLQSFERSVVSIDGSSRLSKSNISQEDE